MAPSPPDRASQSELSPAATWPLDRSLTLAVVAGILGPIELLVVGCIVPWPITFGVFMAISAATVGFLHWCVGPDAFDRSPAAALGSGAATLLMGLGLAGSAWCYRHHICMDGHKAHPPYPGWHAWLDLAWAIALVSSSLATRRCRSVLCLPFAWVAAFLLAYRFAFGSFGGLHDWLPL